MDFALLCLVFSLQDCGICEKMVLADLDIYRTTIGKPISMEDLPWLSFY